MKGIPGIGSASGLPPNIVEQLMQAEKIPIHTLERKKGNSEAKLELVEKLDENVRNIKENISGLASARGFKDIKVSSGDENILSGTGDPLTAATGDWNIEVVQMAEKAAALSNGFPDRDTTEIGVGYLKFETPEGEKEVYINSENSTLNGVARAINEAGVGVQASVIQDREDGDYPWKLMLSGEGVGNDNEVNYPTVYMLDGDMDFHFSQEKKARNGIVKVDGIEIEVSANELDNLIPGVVLDLKRAAPGQPVNLSVKEDFEVISGKVKGFVESINEVFSFIQQQNRLNEASDTTRTLGGDQLLRTIEYRLRNLVQGPVMGTNSNIRQLTQLGIEFTRNGTLEFNKEKFDATLAKSPSNVRSFLSGNGSGTGFIPKLETSIDNILDSSFGPIANKRRSLKNQIDRADQRIESIERRLVDKEKMLRRKFANLEETMSRIKGQGNLLQARLGGGGGGGLMGG